MLSGLRVVELETGPSRVTSLTGKLLADAGARVVVVRDTGGTREAALDHGKGIGTETDVAEADIVLAPPAHDGYAAVAAVNPTAVYGVADAFGDGTRASDFVLQAVGGMLSTTGQPGEPPTRVGVRVGDHLGALYLAVGVLAGHAHRQRTGRGCRVDVTLTDALVSSLNNFVAEYTGKGHLPPPLGNRHLASSPWNLYHAADGDVVICLITDRQWDSLAAIMGHDDLVGRPEFHGQHNRRPRADEIDALVSAWTRDRAVADILAVLSPRGIPCGDIAHLDEVLADPSLYEWGLLRRTDDGGLTTGPLLRVARAVEGAEAAPEPRGLPVDARRPLEGIRVVEIGVAAAGPVGGRILANLGADVIKVEPAKGEVGRRVPPVVGTTSAVFHLNNSDKRSVCVDLTDGPGAEITRRLIAHADVLQENLAPGRLPSWGLDFDELARENPDLIWTSVTGFGQEATGRRLRAYDTVVQAASGLMSVTGFPDGIPTKAGISLSDFFGGLSGAFATMVALTARDLDRSAGRPPTARHIDVSMYATTVWTTLASWPRVLRDGERPGRTGNDHPDVRWQGLLTCVDGAVAVTLHDAADERAAAAVTDDLDRWAAGRSVVEVVDRLRAAGLAVGPLRSVVDLLADDGLRARGVLTSATHPFDGDVAVMGTPIRFSDLPTHVPHPAPVLGGDTATVLREVAGYDDAELAEALAHPTVVQAETAPVTAAPWPARSAPYVRRR
jgi:crotonobetainyl-CoA:carnitine CoA-transferase CaiB-like acyl-CoA transferase